MEKNINFIVKEDEKNLRVDILINKREELISRTRIKNLILKEKLTLNNEIIKSPSKKVSTRHFIHQVKGTTLTFIPFCCTDYGNTCTTTKTWCTNQNTFCFTCF